MSHVDFPPTDNFVHPLPYPRNPPTHRRAQTTRRDNIFFPQGSSYVVIGFTFSYFSLLKPEYYCLLGGAYVPCINCMPLWSYRRRFRSLLLWACDTCDVNCSIAINSLCFLFKTMGVKLSPCIVWNILYSNSLRERFNVKDIKYNLQV